MSHGRVKRKKQKQLLEALFGAHEEMQRIEVGERHALINGEWYVIPPGQAGDQLAAAYYIAEVTKPTITIKKSKPDSDSR